LIVSFLYAPNTRAVYAEVNSFFFVITSFIFPLAVIVSDIEKWKRFMAWWAIVHIGLTLIVLHQGGTGPGGYLRDENDVALAMVMGVPFLYYLAQAPGLKKFFKTVLLTGFVLTIIAVILTASRGGALALIGVIGLMIMYSNKPVRNASIAFAVVIAFGGALLAFLPEGYVDDMSNISNPEDSTRKERLVSWSIAWQMFKGNPMFGVGAGNFPWTNHLYAELSPMWEPNMKLLGGRAAHSLYFTLIPELGLIGIVLFVVIMVAAFKFLKKIKKMSKELNDSHTSQWFTLMQKSMFISLVGYLVGATFISVLYYPLSWHLLAMILVTYRLLDKYRTENQDQGIEVSKENSFSESYMRPVR
jgi:probable O-glycosylation ligase (exosortase A-associated)